MHKKVENPNSNPGGGGGTWVKFYWVYAAGTSKLLTHYRAVGVGGRGCPPPHFFVENVKSMDLMIKEAETKTLSFLRK